MSILITLIMGLLSGHDIADKIIQFTERYL